MNNSELSLVVPCYNEEEAIGTFLATVQNVLDTLDTSYEIVFVNDGSTDGTLRQLLSLSKSEPRLRVIDLTRNFGKEAALTAGLDHASGQAVIPMDVDLQDPPWLIEEMLKKWREGYDVVYAVRARRDADSFLKHTTADLFYKVYNKVSTIPIPQNAGDFRLMDRRVVEALKKLPERNRFMKGLFGWLGFRQAEISYARPARAEGQTKFNYWKLWNFALDGVTSFTTVPLRVWTYLGGLVAGFSFFYGVFLIARTIIYGVDVPGYASLMVVVLFLGGTQLVSLGVIGEYLGRAYEEVKGRPIYLIDQIYHSGKPGAFYPSSKREAN